MLQFISDIVPRDNMIDMHRRQCDSFAAFCASVILPLEESLLFIGRNDRSGILLFHMSGDAVIQPRYIFI